MSLNSANRTIDGNPIVHTTSKPFGTNTFFFGAGDDGDGYVGAGDRLLFKLSASDSSKYIDVEFAEDVYIKDGFIQAISAPFGACFSVEIIDSESIVQGFVKHAPIYGDTNYYFSSNDNALLTTDYKIRVTVANSDGTGGQDAAAAFKCCGWLEVYRKTTTGKIT